MIESLKIKGGKPWIEPPNLGKLFTLALLEAEDMPEVFEIVNREADLTMNRVVVMIKEMGMQDQVTVLQVRVIELGRPS